jgi:hypothetical protein
MTILIGEDGQFACAQPWTGASDRAVIAKAARSFICLLFRPFYAGHSIPGPDV